MNELAKTLVVTSSNTGDFMQRITSRLPPFLESLGLHSDIWTLEIASSSKLYGTDFLQRLVAAQYFMGSFKVLCGKSELNYFLEIIIISKCWAVIVATVSFSLLNLRTSFLHIPCTPKQNVFVIVPSMHQKDLYQSGFKIALITNT